MTWFFQQGRETEMILWGVHTDCDLQQNDMKSLIFITICQFSDATKHKRFFFYFMQIEQQLPTEVSDCTVS